MAKNRSVNATRTKDAVEYLYSLAKRKGYLDDVMRIANVTNAKSLQWSYRQGRISEEQVSAYVQALGVDRDFIIGAREMTSSDKDNLERTLPDRATDNQASSVVTSSENTNEDSELEDVYAELIEEAEGQTLANIKLNLQILMKKVEIRELELQIVSEEI